VKLRILRPDRVALVLEDEMKSIVTITAVALGFIASPALAQDEEDWSGAYIGIQSGYTGTKSDTAVALSGQWSVESQALRDFFSNNMGARQSDGSPNTGVVLGYNVQTGGAVVGSRVSSLT
jgi:hypothetical protein